MTVGSRNCYWGVTEAADRWSSGCYQELLEVVACAVASYGRKEVVWMASKAAVDAPGEMAGVARSLLGGHC